MMMYKIRQKLTVKLLLPLLLLAGFCSLPVHAAKLQKSEIQQVGKDVQKMVAEVVEILKIKVEDKTSRHPQILARIQRQFDFRKMAKLSLGKRYWKKFNKKQRKEFLKKSILKMKTTYLGKLDLYTDETLKYGTVKAKKKKILVQIFLMSDQDTTEMVYKLYNSKRGWRVYDVEVRGVSVLKTYHSQFNGMLDDKGYQGLMESLAK